MPTIKAENSMNLDEKKTEFLFSKEFLEAKDETKNDLQMRINGISNKRGSTGKQFAGYTTLEQFYRGDQWEKDEAPGASQKTDNYCAVIVDNLSSLLFDDSPEINCPTDDPTDDIAEIKAEMKERVLWKVWKDNNFETEFDSWSKQASLYGDGFLKGPWMQKINSDGDTVGPEEKGDWKICFQHIENPATIRLIFADSTHNKLLGFIHSDRIPLSKAVRLYGAAAEKKGIKIEASLNPAPELGGILTDDKMPMVNIEEYWTNKKMGVFINDKLLSISNHNWGFVPLEFVKNTYVPNHPYGKSDIEDVLDPQLSHNRTNNDLANLLKWISSINMWGKNLEGMQALVAGLSRIYSLPDDGEIHTFEKTGDPYITNTYVQQRRSSIIEISGVSEAMLSSSQVANASGRALALAFQGTIRKLLEIYYPKTKVFIEGDYRTEVYLPTTLLRNVIDTINKFSAGLISQDTAMREAGVAQPNLEKKLMKKDLTDPVLGPQVARQPALLPRLNEGQNGGGENPMPQPGNQPSASPEGAVAAGAQQANGVSGPVQ